MQQNFAFSGDNTPDWRIDEHTKSVGRQGIAAARRILEATSPEAFSTAA